MKSTAPNQAEVRDKLTHRRSCTRCKKYETTITKRRSQKQKALIILKEMQGKDTTPRGGEAYSHKEVIISPQEFAQN